MQTVIYRVKINNKLLAHHTGNHTQYPVIHHNGKEYLKKSIYAKLSILAIQQRLAQHCQSTILQFLKTE